MAFGVLNPKDGFESSVILNRSLTTIFGKTSPGQFESSVITAKFSKNEFLAF